MLKMHFVSSQVAHNVILLPKHAAAIEKSEISLAVPCLLQDALLVHPAAGWFITRSSWNSVQEAFLAQVPILVALLYISRNMYVLYELNRGNQPGNALLMSIRHEAGFEFLSGR
jgi:hypothetical protein